MNIELTSEEVELMRSASRAVFPVIATGAFFYYLASFVLSASANTLPYDFDERLLGIVIKRLVPKPTERQSSEHSSDSE